MDIIAPEIAHLNFAEFMREAIKEAEQAGQAGELPIGALVVLDGEIISRGRARHKALKSQVRHAELNAILDGGDLLWTEYKRAILFTTCEPCPLCLGAAVMADIPHIIFALHDKVVYTATTIEVNPYVRRHIKSYHGGVLEEETTAMFGRYNPDTLRYIQTGR